MEYELLKRLKDAGFPYPEGWDDHVVVPTLSTLIEACGSKLTLQRSGANWHAWNHGVHEDHHDQTHETPEGALALLWLALNPT